MKRKGNKDVFSFPSLFCTLWGSVEFGQWVGENTTNGVFTNFHITNLHLIFFPLSHLIKATTPSLFYILSSLLIFPCLWLFLKKVWNQYKRYVDTSNPNSHSYDFILFMPYNVNGFLFFFFSYFQKVELLESLCVQYKREVDKSNSSHSRQFSFEGCWLHLRGMIVQSSLPCHHHHFLYKT